MYALKELTKNIALWMVILLFVFLFYEQFRDKEGKPEDVVYSDLMADVKAGKVEEIEIKGHVIKGKYKKGEYKDRQNFKTYGPSDYDTYKDLDQFGVKVEYVKDDEGWLGLFLMQWLPLIFFVAIFFFFMKQMQGGGKAMSFGKSRARLLEESSNKVTFEDVAGIDEAKEEVEEIIAFLKDPKKFTRLGGRIPKGALLMGVPGSGKTLLAKAIAGEAGVPFFSISGSDFVEMFVGVGASRVRDLFVQGKKHAPCIIFIDEIDAVGRHRGAGLGGGHDEREQTLNQLLVEMDGFESNEGVILLAATNRPDVLDPALLRPGRFDRRIVVPRPDIRGREGILKVHTKRTPTAPDVDLSTIARGTPGFSGADLENLVNEAALIAAQKNRESIHAEDFDSAKDKILMGRERRSQIISEEEKKITAYHEAGHALVAMNLENADPVHKVSIIPRGMALGVTQQLPVEDKHTYSRRYVEDQIAVFMGGRVAEELVLKSMTTGAGHDIETATDLARKMVCEWGMSEKLGPLSFGQKDEQIFLGREIAQHRDYSEETARTIDREVMRIVQENYGRATKILGENLEILHSMADRLLERETLTARDVEKICKGEPLPPLDAPKEKEKKKPLSERLAMASSGPSQPDLFGEEKKVRGEEETPADSDEGPKSDGAT